MSKNADYLGTLEAAILIQHQCKAAHRKTVYVEEKTADGQIIREGNVDCFDLIGHKEARACFAWQHVDALGHAKISAVLGNRFVDSPQRAAQAAVFTDAQPPVHPYSKELELLKQQLQEFKQFFRQLEMKAADLTAAIHAGHGIHEATDQQQRKRAA